MNATLTTDARCGYGEGDLVLIWSDFYDEWKAVRVVGAEVVGKTLTLSLLGIRPHSPHNRRSLKQRWMDRKLNKKPEGEILMSVEETNTTPDEAVVSTKKVELKLPCSETNCDEIAVSLRLKPKATIYEIDMGNGNYRYGLTSWGQPPTNKKQMDGLTAQRILFDIKENYEPIGILESKKRVAL